MNWNKSFDLIKNYILDIPNKVFDFIIWNEAEYGMSYWKNQVEVEAVSSDYKSFLICVNKSLISIANKRSGYTIVDENWQCLVDWLFSSTEFFDDIVVLRKDIDNTNGYIAIYDVSSGVRLIHDKKTNIINKDNEIVTIVTWWKYKWTTATIECEKDTNTINLFKRAGDKLWQMDISNNNYFQDFLRETTFWRIVQSYKIEDNFDVTIKYWVNTKFYSENEKFKKRDILFKLPDRLQKIVFSSLLKDISLQSNGDIFLISKQTDELWNSLNFILDNKWNLITIFDSNDFWIDIPFFNILWGWIYCSHMLDSGKYWKFLPQTVLWIWFKDLKRWLCSIDWETYFDKWWKWWLRPSLFDIEHNFEKILHSDDKTITINWKKFNKKLLRLN